MQKPGVGRGCIHKPRCMHYGRPSTAVGCIQTLVELVGRPADRSPAGSGVIKNRPFADPRTTGFAPPCIHSEIDR